MSFLRTLLLPVLCLGELFGAAMAQHPLYFEQRSAGLFEARDTGKIVAIRPDRLEVDGVTLRFLRASKAAHLDGLGSPAPSTYILGPQTRTFRQYPKARIRRLYPGVDATFYGTPGHLEYDLDVAGGAPSGRIRIGVTGARSLRIDNQGSLIVATRSGELRELAPQVFQDDGGVRRPVPARYVLLARNEIGFQIGAHDRRRPLTIDPVIVYQKYFGGSGSDVGGPVATDAQGNVYVAGQTNSIDFPVTNGTKALFQPPLVAYSDAGQKVTPLPVATQTSVTAIAGTADGNVLYVATPDGIFISGNHGASWTQAIPLTPSGIVNAISVDQLDPSRAWVATNAGLFQLNTDGQVGGEDDFGLAIGGDGHVNAASVVEDPADPLTVYATTAAPNYLYKTTNFGENWQQLFPAYPGEPAAPAFPGTNLTIALGPNSSALYVVDNNSFLLKSTDGGMTWQRLASGLYGAKSITLDPNKPSTIYVVDNFGVQRSTDGGETFATISPTLSNGDFVQSFAMDAGGALYISTFSQIEVSTDNGTTWKTLPPRTNPHVLVGLGGQVFAGTDSSTTAFLTKWSPDGSQLLYSTFFGGSYSSQITAIAVDAQGEAILAGDTSSPDFPVTKTIAPASPGNGSGFVTKLSADGSQVVYSSIIGASQTVSVANMAVDASGATYITGNTAASNFPTTSGAFQPKLPSATCQRPPGGGFEPILDTGSYAFASKLSADGSSLVYSTFLAGACGSNGQGIAVDSAGEAVVVGATTSPDFPVPANAYQSTFPGGPAAGATPPSAVDMGFVSKLSAAGDKLIASSFIGGGSVTDASAVALDSSGDPYITGATTGITPGATPGVYQPQPNFECVIFNIVPVVTFSTDAFLLKLDPAFTTAQFLTYLGTGCITGGNSIVLQPSGNVWIAGLPAQGFPLVAPYELSGAGNYFVSEFNADASQLLFSSYSDGQYIAQDPGGAIYVSGSGLAASSPPKNVPFTNDASLTKINPNSSPQVIIDFVGPSAPNQKVNTPVNPYASYVAPGELIAITGQNLGPSDTVMAKLDQTGHLPFVVSGTSVSFNDLSAPLISVQDSLIVCFVPFEVSGITNIMVTANGQQSAPVRAVAPPTAPYILTIVNQDGTVNSSSHPAPQGSIVAIYVTGLGITTPLSQDGSVSYPPLPVPAAPIVADVGQNPVQPAAVTAAYGLVAGITQINLPIPKADYSKQNPIYVSINAAQAQIYIAP